MDTYSKTYEVIWADMDPNRHMRHSVYNDYAAQTRVAMFSDFGLSIENIAKLGLGPILFREETRFLREIHLSDKIKVTCSVLSMRKDGSKWSFRHEILKQNDVKAATIVVDGAWLDLHKRKVGTPTEELREMMHLFPRAETFKWLDKKLTD